MTESRKLALSIIVVVVALAGAGTWLALGMSQTSKLEQSTDQKRRDLTTLQEKIAAVPALRQERQKLGSELEEYETILPSDREINKILDTMSDFQKKAGLQIKQFTPMREKTDNKSTTSYKKVSYELDLVGDYFSFVRFLNLLETHNRFIQIDSFSIKQKDEGSLVDEITLRLSTFVYDPKAKPVTKVSAKASAKAPAKKAGAAKKGAPEVPFDLKRELRERFVFADGVKMRDPFSNPLTRRVVLAKVDNPKVVNVPPSRMLTADEERALVDDAEKKLAEADQLVAADKLDDAAKLLAETNAVRGQAFRDAELVGRGKALSETWQTIDLKVRIARGEKLYRAVEQTYEKMTAAFETEDYDEVFRLRADVDAALGQALAAQLAPAKPKAPAKADPKSVKKLPAPPPEEKAPEGDPVHERLVEVVKACDALVARAEVRKEFAAVGIKIQGTFWSGRGDSRRAVAIINGQTVAEGEVLKGALGKTSARSKTSKNPARDDGEIVVKKIERDHIVFAYKDELIERSQFKTN